MQGRTDGVDRFGDIVAGLVSFFLLDFAEIGHRFYHRELAVDLILEHELDFTDRLIAHSFASSLKPVIDPPRDSTHENDTKETDSPRADSRGTRPDDGDKYYRETQ